MLLIKKRHKNIACMTIKDLENYITDGIKERAIFQGQANQHIIDSCTGKMLSHAIIINRSSGRVVGFKTIVLKEVVEMYK